MGWFPLEPTGRAVPLAVQRGESIAPEPAEDLAAS